MDKARLQMFGNMLKLIGGVEKFSLEKFKRLQVTRRELPKFMALVFEKVIIYNILFTFMLTISVVIISFNLRLIS